MRNVTDDQTVWPAPEALHLATTVIRRGYMLPETAEHPIIKSEFINLALLVVAWGLAAAPAAKKAAAPAKAAPQTTVTLKHLAAALSDSHDLPKKQAEAVLGDLVTLTTRHLKKGDKIHLNGLGIL